MSTSLKIARRRLLTLFSLAASRASRDCCVVCADSCFRPHSRLRVPARAPPLSLAPSLAPACAWRVWSLVSPGATTVYGSYVSNVTRKRVRGRVSKRRRTSRFAIACRELALIYVIRYLVINQHIIFHTPDPATCALRIPTRIIKFMARART